MNEIAGKIFEITGFSEFESQILTMEIEKRGGIINDMFDPKNPDYLIYNEYTVVDVESSGSLIVMNGTQFFEMINM